MNQPMSSTYVIITPAKNEELFIHHVLDSVTKQTLKPLRWVIVDDSSADRTAEIAREYADRYDFITLIRLTSQNQRSFAKKANAFNAGLEAVKDLDYRYIGNLDADISFASDYFQNVVKALDEDPQLGLTGGIVFTKFDNEFVTADKTIDSVAGAVQLFRRDCFEQVGGYRPLEHGGIDAAAEISARMKGWTVRKSLENPVWEHRTTGTAKNGVFAASFKLGMRFHSLGYGTLFFFFRSIARVKDKPYFLGSLLCLSGFLYAKIRGCPIKLPAEIVSYLRKEQMSKLRQRFFGWPAKSDRAFMKGL
jgi:glycosyltransferase involved in cell wall biosynthesis